MNLKSTFFIVLLILCVLFAVSSVSAADNQTEMLAEDEDFEELNQSISQSSDELNLTHDYKYDFGEILIEKEDKFVINGNDHMIEGVSNCQAFEILCQDSIVINNLTFKDCNNMSILFSSSCVLDNVKFINCSGLENDSFLYVSGSDLLMNNCYFEWNYGTYNVIYTDGSVNMTNCLFNGGKLNGSIISTNRGNLFIENTVFENMTAKLGTVINYKGNNLVIKKSKFSNLHARLSGGAILAKYFPESEDTDGRVAIRQFLIEDCEFINVTSTNDGGAIYFDLDSGSDYVIKNFNIANSNFTSCASRFGGAIAIQGGRLNIDGSNFINNSASFEGGALFTTWSDVNITDSNLINNTGEKNAGAIYFDKGRLVIKFSNLLNNKAIAESDNAANCIYAHDVEAYFSNSTFDNGAISVYADFAGDSKLENVTKNDDIFLLNNKNYIVSVESEGIKLNLTNNEIAVDKLPSKFDLREWGWVTPAKYQGDNDDCWAFATVGSLESSLLRATGQSYDLAQNYVQKLQLKYYPIGDLRNSLTGFAYSGLGYALSWYGAILSDSDYDDRGMISDTDLDVARIHLQDAMIIFGGRNDTIDLIKRAVLKYGPVSIQLCSNDPPDELNTTGEDIAIMDHSIHFVSIIGWDDSLYDDYTESFGSWIFKDSLTGFIDQPYSDPNVLGIDYYAIVPQNAGICYIFENDIDYHVNYQTDLTGLTGFDGNYAYYSNEFTSKYDELIGAVGTYFNDSGIDYSFDVYVNNVKVHSQSGVSEFAGFRTIVLSKYIPIKTGDKFKVVFKSNALPYQAYSRMHYINGMTFVSADGKSWSDITLENKTVCLKAYTVADDTKITGNKNIAVDYAGGSYFSVKVVTADGHAVGAGEIVKFKINGKTTTVKTNNNGIAKIKITDIPKKYTITTTYKGESVKNTVTVKQVLTANKVTVKKTAKKFTLSAKLKINGKLVKGKKITFKFKGKTYKAKTNAKGIAKLTIKKNVIKKLKKGTYSVIVTYSKDKIKTTVKVK